MGFKRRTYLLAFEDPTLEGLEVRVHAATIDQIVELNKVWRPELLNSAADLDEQARAALFDMLAEGIVSWNREEDDGTAIEPTAKALRAEDVDLVGAIVKGWSKASSGVARPLDRPSSGGAPSPEVSIPMEPLSGSPESLPEPS